MSTDTVEHRRKVEEEALLEGQLVFKGPQKNLFDEEDDS